MATAGWSRRTAATAFVGVARPSGPRARISYKFTHRFGGRAKLLEAVLKPVRQRLPIEKVGQILASAIMASMF